MLILLIGLGTLALYQMLAINDELEEVTRSVDQMDGKVKRAQYEKTKFFAIARDLIRLSPTDANAAKITEKYKLKQLEEAQPELFSANAPMTNAPTAATPPASSNAAPLTPATNNAAVSPPIAH